MVAAVSRLEASQLPDPNAISLANRAVKQAQLIASVAAVVRDKVAELLQPTVNFGREPPFSAGVQVTASPVKPTTHGRVGMTNSFGGDNLGLGGAAAVPLVQVPNSAVSGKGIFCL